MNFKTYEELRQLYQANSFDQILEHEEGVLFLKIRSITRKVLIIEFAKKLGLSLQEKNSKILTREIINHPKTPILIDKFITIKFQDELKERKQYQNKLISELYKLREFDWGGLYQNNLEKTIVDNYIKKIKTFDTLIDKIDSEIQISLRGYVLCSWFNHWTSILIEDIFKQHKRVLPAIGLIKKVDFFVDSIPFDLKVTYFPDGYMAFKRKERGLKSELAELKQIAKKENIPFENSKKDKFLTLELFTRLSESHLQSVKKSIVNFHETRWEIIKETIADKGELIKWLYEQQGERRFDSANRLFLILIDKESLGESWKLKRNIDFLEANIKSYLDNFRINNSLEITFNWKEKIYTTVSDALFVIKD